ncbi:HXXEE domain-containing protein [Paenibacillus sp. SI8]|uniref:HXXEE domain-containing protein n=1 Tax=unclassified Paenibacillus TaxID=185978 RepID=UPI003465308F
MHWLNEHISLHSLIWLFIVTFMIHDFEEIIFVERWMNKNHASARLALPKPLRRRFDSFRNITSSQFAVAVALEFIIFIPTTIMAADFHYFLLFIGFNAILLIHVFTHLFQVFFLRMYTPGVVTAVFVTLPYSVYLFYRLAEIGVLNWSLFLNSLNVGLILLPLVIFGHIIAKRIIPNQ